MTTQALPTTRRAANAAPRASRSRRRRPRSTERHTLTGPVAWVDPHAALVVLRVERTSLRARRFMGATVTVDLSGARMSAPDRNRDGEVSAADLLPGERISVGVTLPVGVDRLPRVVAARTAVCASFA
jgi:hypothetical protein